MNHQATIVYGSCNSLGLPVDQSLWQNSILSSKPDIFIFGGDNIYGDHHASKFPYTNQPTTPAVLEQQYEKLNNLEFFRDMKNNGTKVVAIFDDHDYGLNDADREFALKDISKQIFLKKFLNEPAHSKRWKREGGAYEAHLFDFNPDKTTSTKEKKKNYSIGIVLLDVRTSRSPWGTVPSSSPSGGGEEEPTMLGKSQWKWLEEVLCNGRGYVDGVTGNEIAKEQRPMITFIASGIQILPEHRRGEAWTKFPKERERLLNLIISKCKVRNPILLSGDVHMAELNVAKCSTNTNSNNNQTRELMEITSSGMTHSWCTRFVSWIGDYKVINFFGCYLLMVAHNVMPWNYIVNSQSYYLKRNVARLQIDFAKEIFQVEILDSQGKTVINRTIALLPEAVEEEEEAMQRIIIKENTSICDPINGRPSRLRVFVGMATVVSVVVLLPLFLMIRFFKLVLSVIMLATTRLVKKKTN